MGIFSRIKSWRENSRERLEYEGKIRDEREVRSRHRAWERDLSESESLVRDLRNWRDLVDESQGSDIITKKGEEILITARGAGLAETRRQRGHYSGGSHGVSFRIAKGVRYRVGAHRGTFEQGEEAQTLIDTGTFVVTNMRAVFVGSKQNREWAWSKLISVSRDAMPSGDEMLLMAVSNRQKVSGVIGDPESIDSIHQRVELGVAIYGEHEREFFADLDRQLEELVASEPRIIETTTENRHSSTL